MPNPADRIADNYARVRQRCDDAAQRGGRATDSVRLVAITKYVDVDLMNALIACGCTELGESRPQQLWEKAAAIDADVRWHLVGHLQRNKVDRTVPIVTWIHSVDSRRLLNAINTSVEKQHLPPLRALLEINISGDEQKHGLTSSEAREIVAELNDVPHVTICGLMGMASMVDDQRILRSQFGSLRELSERLAGDMPEGHSIQELSMGMSGDFEIAIEEGATMVRVGSALFEGCGV